MWPIFGSTLTAGGRPATCAGALAMRGNCDTEETMANLNVSYQELTDAATRLTNGQDEITTKLNELKGFIESLISSGFVTDQASVAFGESYRQFTQGATDTVGALTNLGEYLRKAASTLEDADTQLASGLRG